MRMTFRSTALGTATVLLVACNSESVIAPDNSPVSVNAVQADVHVVSAASANDALNAIGTGLSGAGVSYLVAPSGSMGLVATGGANATAPTCTYSQATGFYSCVGGKERGLTVTRKFRIFVGGAAAGVPGISGPAGLADSTQAIWQTVGTDTTVEDGRTRIRIVNRADTNMSVITRDTVPPRLPTKFTNNGHGTQADTVTFADSNGVKTYTMNNDVRVTNVVRKAPEAQHPFPASGTITVTVNGTMSFTPSEKSKDGPTQRAVAGVAVITFNGTQKAGFTFAGKSCDLDLASRKVSNCK